MAKILIVDDSRELVDVFSMIFEANKFEVRSAGDRSGLQQQMHSFEPDVVLLDVRLGGEDGRVLCREIRELYADHKFAVLLLSASLELLKDYRNFGADDFLEKPFDIQTVINKVNDLLNR